MAKFAGPGSRPVLFRNNTCAEYLRAAAAHCDYLANQQSTNNEYNQSNLL